MDLHQPVQVSFSNKASSTRSVSPNVEEAFDANPDQLPNDSGLPKDLPPKHLTQRLIDSFLTRFHVYFLILDKNSFISSVEDGSVSATLLRSVLFVSAIQCDPEVYHLLGYSTRNDAGDELFASARNSFDSDSTSDRTAMLQSCFLLHYWWGQPTAFKDSLWWLYCDKIRAVHGNTPKHKQKQDLPRNTNSLEANLVVSLCELAIAMLHTLSRAN